MFSRYSSAERVARRFILAGFIPDKFWVTKKRELKRLLTRPIPRVRDLAWEIQGPVVDFFQAFERELIAHGMHHWATARVKAGVEQIIKRVREVGEHYEKLGQELGSAFQDRKKSTEGAVAYHISYLIGEVLERKVKNALAAFKQQYVLPPGAIAQLTAKVIKKATPQEREAIDYEWQHPEDFGHPSLRVRYAFYNRIGLEKASSRLLQKVPVDVPFDPFDDIDYLLQALTNTMQEDTLAGFEDFMVGEMKVIVVAKNIGQYSSGNFVKQLVYAHALMKRRGFGRLWYGTIFIMDINSEQLSEAETKRYEEYGYKKMEARAGAYHSGADTMMFYHRSENFVATLVHELGHRYWYKFMKPAQRARFNSMVKTNPSEKTRDYPSGHTREDGVEKPVSPVSDYGWSTIEEAFAEAFEHYILQVDMTPEQVSSLKMVLA